MYIFDNITLAMMELYSMGQKSSAHATISDYFILKLDDINHNKEVSKYFSNLPIQNISDILVENYNEIFLGYSSEKKTHIIENEKGKLLRETFFKDDNNGSHIYLGSLITLPSEVKEKLSHYFRNALISPNLFKHDFESLMLDADKFSKLSDKELLHYKKFIDENMDCYATLLSTNSRVKKEDLLQKIQEEWKKTMLTNKYSHRLKAYDKACELESEDERF